MEWLYMSAYICIVNFFGKRVGTVTVNIPIPSILWVLCNEYSKHQFWVQWFWGILHVEQAIKIHQLQFLFRPFWRKGFSSDSPHVEGTREVAFIGKNHTSDSCLNYPWLNFDMIHRFTHLDVQFCKKNNPSNNCSKKSFNPFHILYINVSFIS